MRRLALPNFDFSTALAETINGIGNKIIQEKYRNQIANPATIEKYFQNNAKAATLYKLPRVDNGNDDAIVYGNLKKIELTKLYTQYFSATSKPARRLYDQIKVTSNGKCPFCGDIGHVRTLDHYAPKANFPLYSVMPGNLIPCCRDCNTEKLDAFSTTLEGQTLNPYFDDEKFFNEKWVAAKVIKNNPPVVEYYLSPPVDWPHSDKKRVDAHFTEYGLVERFSVEAAAALPEVIATRKTILRGSSPQDYAEHLHEVSNNLNLPINNWRRVMFSCLAEDLWFCSHKH